MSTDVSVVPSIVEVIISRDLEVPTHPVETSTISRRLSFQGTKQVRCVDYKHPCVRRSVREEVCQALQRRLYELEVSNT